MRRRKTTQAGHSPMPSDGSHAPASVAAGGHEASQPSAGDLNAYLAHLAHLDMPPAMKIELIVALRAIMQNFVDRAFGDDPVQQVGKRHGWPEGKPDAGDADSNLPMIGLSPTTPTETDNNELTGAFRTHAGHGGSRK